MNGECTKENGSHLEGVYDGIVDAAIQGNSNNETDYALRKNSMIKDKKILVSVWLDAPSFEGATKSKLSMQTVRKIIAKNVSQNLSKISDSEEWI